MLSSSFSTRCSLIHGGSSLRTVEGLLCLSILLAPASWLPQPLLTCVNASPPTHPPGTSGKNTHRTASGYATCCTCWQARARPGSCHGSPCKEPSLPHCSLPSSQKGSDFRVEGHCSCWFVPCCFVLFLSSQNVEVVHPHQALPSRGGGLLSCFPTRALVCMACPST